MLRWLKRLAIPNWQRSFVLSFYLVAGLLIGSVSPGAANVYLITLVIMGSIAFVLFINHMSSSRQSITSGQGDDVGREAEARPLLVKDDSLPSKPWLKFMPTAGNTITVGRLIHKMIMSQIDNVIDESSYDFTALRKVFEEGETW